MAAEPTNEQLREFIEEAERYNWYGSRWVTERIQTVCRALLAAREELEYRQPCEQCGGKKTYENETCPDCLGSGKMSISESITNARMMREESERELAERDTQIAALRNRVAQIHDRVASQQLESACGLCGIALTESTADSAKWLEERLAEARRHEGCRTRNQILDSFGLSHRCYTSEEETVSAVRSAIGEAEHRGYERGKAEGEIAGLRKSAEIALAWEEGVVTTGSFREFADWARESIAAIERQPVSIFAELAEREIERQLAARREKAETR